MVVSMHENEKPYLLSSALLTLICTENTLSPVPRVSNVDLKVHFFFFFTNARQRHLAANLGNFTAKELL